MKMIRRSFIALGSLIGLYGSPICAGILQDVTDSANKGSQALLALGFKADFTFESIQELERFMKENVEAEGGAKSNGELSSNVGNKLFSLGSYLGEVIRRKIDGTWEGDDADPDVTVNVAVKGPKQLEIFPIQRIMKRLQNGEEDDVWAFARITIDSVKD
jgi:hypothetical protein